MREIVVDPRTGKWYTVGDNGAEFINIPAGAIVFNHKQTESLFQNGYVSGRASALVSGTALVTGGISGSGISKPSSSGGYSSGSSGDSGSGSSPWYGDAWDKYTEFDWHDWVEVFIDRVERGINKIVRIAESAFKNITNKTNATFDEISAISNEISVQQRAYDRYMEQAEKVPLYEETKEKIRNGTIDIEQYQDEGLERVEEYTKWYEKALDCKDAIDELHESLAQLYKDQFDNIQKDFENKLALMEKSSDTYNREIEMLEEQGYLQNADYYKQLQEIEKSNVSTLNKELAALQSAFSQAMASGEIEEGSEAWYEMKLSIEDTKASAA